MAILSTFRRGFLWGLKSPAHALCHYDTFCRLLLSFDWLSLSYQRLQQPMQFVLRPVWLFCMPVAGQNLYTLFTVIFSSAGKFMYSDASTATGLACRATPLLPCCP